MLIISQTKKHQLYAILWLIIGVTYLSHQLTNNILISCIILVPQIVGCNIIRQFQLNLLGLKEEQFPSLKRSLFFINLTGVVFGLLIFIAIQFPIGLGLKLFIINQVVYHMGEFLHVCFYKFQLLAWKSFLINHSVHYNVALSFAIFEYWIEYYFLTKEYKMIIILGLIMVTVGHIFRIGAFLSAKESFHHLVQSKKAPDHILVTDGVYSISRHPSYFGFWIFSLGQQLILMNPIAFVLYIPVLYKFFIDRINYEEYLLIRFFGEEYQKYSKKTPTLIPFIDRWIN